MDTSGYGVTDVGRRRGNNEDCFLIDDTIGLYVVCDGIGGHSGGEIASEEAAEALHAFLCENEVELRTFRDVSALRDVQDLLVRGIKHASRVVHDLGESSGLYKMGTTMTALLTIGDRGVIASVGDSRAYHCRKKRAKLLTKDHTLANEMLIAGVWTPEEAHDSPFRHSLTRSIGTDDEVEVDTLVTYLVPGDIFLLCTDGLSQYFETESDLGAFMFHEPPLIPSQLVDFAIECGGSDNVTALVVWVDETHVEHQPQRGVRRWLTRVA